MEDLINYSWALAEEITHGSGDEVTEDRAQSVAHEFSVEVLEVAGRQTFRSCVATQEYPSWRNVDDTEDYQIEGLVGHSDVRVHFNQEF